ncbi:Transferase [Arabidopsis thaliana x Arabidopsis arenosa]|nr:Transferase [Arabidopsis thaliana x Arabidopsis arenosa]
MIILLTPCTKYFDSNFRSYSYINAPPGLESKIMESMCYFLYEKDGKRTLKPPPRGDISTDLVRITLQLTQEKVKKLKERAKQESARSLHDLYFSTFVVTMAYLWSCLVKARGGSKERTVLSMYSCSRI